MAGVNWPKRGTHWSRLGSEATVSGEENRQLIIAAHKYTEHTISNDDLWSLIRSVAMAKHEDRKAQQRAATHKDTLRSLRAMLTLDDALLLDALSKCDAQTRGDIYAAQNLIPGEDIDWVSSDEGCGEVHGPRAIRRSVQDALNAAAVKKCPRGPKKKPYQIALARTCLVIWQGCRQKKAPGRLEFTRAAFNAAGMYLHDKRIGALLSKVGKSRM
jgi:hypothetical protein